MAYKVAERFRTIRNGVYNEEEEEKQQSEYNVAQRMDTIQRSVNNEREKSKLYGNYSSPTAAESAYQKDRQAYASYLGYMKELADKEAGAPKTNEEIMARGKVAAIKNNRLTELEGKKGPDTSVAEKNLKGVDVDTQNDLYKAVSYTNKGKLGKAEKLFDQIKSNTGWDDNTLNSYISETYKLYEADNTLGKMTTSEAVEYSKAKIDALPKDQKDLINRWSNTIADSSKTQTEILNNKHKYKMSDYVVNKDEDYASELKAAGWTDRQIDEYRTYATRVANANAQEEYNSQFDIDPNKENNFWDSARNTLYSLSPRRAISGGNLGALNNGGTQYGLGRDLNDPLSSVQRSGEYAQNQVTQNAITDAHPFGQWAYQTGMSTAQSAENILAATTLGTAGVPAKAAQLATLVPFATSAYNSGYEEARERGANESQAQMFGIASGAAEAGTELISLDHLWDMADGTRVGKNLILNWLAQGGIEGSEEAASDLLNRYSDYLILGDDGKNAMTQNIQAYIDQGMSEEDAKKQANLDFWKQVGEDALSGAASGLVMGGGATAMGAINSSNIKNRANEISENYKQMAAETKDPEEKARYEQIAANPYQYMADQIDTSTEYGQQSKEQILNVAERVNRGKKVTMSDRAEVSQSLDVANAVSDYVRSKETALNEAQRVNVPEQYRSNMTDVDENTARKHLAKAAKDGDSNGMTDAYHEMKNSRSATLRDRADEIFNEYAAMARRNGADAELMESGKVSTHDAYLAGINGEEFTSTSDKNTQAYNAGKEQAIKNKAKSTIETKDSVKNVQATDSKGHTITLTGEFKDGKAVTSEGKLVDLEKVTLEDNAVGTVLRMASFRPTDAESNAYLNNIEDGVKVAQYNRDFLKFYKAGQANLDLDKELSGLHMISDETAKSIYQAGYNDLVNESRKAAMQTVHDALNIKKGTGSLVDSRTKAKNDAAYKTANLVSKVLGVDIELVDDMAANGQKVNASFNASTSKITVSSESAKQLFHEVGEFVEFYNAEGHESLRKGLNQAAIEVLGSERYAEWHDRYMEAYKKAGDAQTSREITNEMTNDLLVSLMETSKGREAMAKYLAEHSGEEEARTFGQKVSNLFKSIADSIRSLVKNEKGMQAEVLRRGADKLEEYADEFISALDTAIQNYQGNIIENATEEQIELSDVNTAYSLRVGDEPKKTIKAYKVFVAFENDPGNLYPPMVASPGGAATPLGVWVNADTGEINRDKDGNIVVNTKGRMQVQQGGKGTNKPKSGGLAWRPGWHLGAWPDAIQFAGKKDHMLPEHFVFAECEIAADIDYQNEAVAYGVNEQGKFNRTQAGLPYIPKDGFYKYRTNPDPNTAPWYITGAMKVTRILDDEESRKICAEFGVTPLARRGGDIDLSKYGLKAGPVTPTKDLSYLPKATDYSDEIKNLPGYKKGVINFDDENVRAEYERNGLNPEDYRNISYLDEVVNEKTEKVGITVDPATESGFFTTFSVDTWTESDYVAAKDEAAESLAKALDISKKKALKYIDDVNSIAKIIADDRARLDYEANPYSSAFVSNVEYGGSIDFSTICKKRLLYTGTLQAIQKQIGNRVITMQDYLDIRNAMLEDGLQTTCGCCYVEGSRAKLGQFMEQFIKRYAADNPSYVPTMYDVTMPDGIRQLKANHPEVYEAREYFLNHMGQVEGHEGEKNLFGSQGKPKDYTERTEYRGEILDKFLNKKETVAAKNLNGGLRLQSFSDFEIVNLIDCMQVIMDMSRCGLAGQAYTKVYEFADALGNTGLKINLSLMAKDVVDGKLVLDEVNGMKKSDAIELRNKYSKNVGTIIVCFTDDQIKAAMASDYIDYIIPFHRSQWRKSQYEALGLPIGTKDYTLHQNDRTIKENGKLKKAERNMMPNEYWDFGKSGRENAQKYIDICNSEHKAPKFAFLLDKVDGKYVLPEGKEYDGYFKLLIDFKMYDNDGVGSPQMPVVPNFSMEEAKKMLDDYTGGHDTFPVAQNIADKFAEKISKRGPEFKYSVDIETDIDDDIDLLDLEIEDLLSDFEKELLNRKGSWLDATSLDDIMDGLREDATPQQRTWSVHHLTKAMMGDEFKLVNGKKLVFTDERIDKMLKMFAATNADYAQAYVTYMSPEQFLLLTANSDEGASRLNIIKEQSTPLDLKNLSDESQPIYISIDENEKKVIGHEGRHRMYALQVAGYTQIPVLVFNYNNKYSKVSQSNLKLEPQTHPDMKGKYNKSNKVTLDNLVPLSTGNKQLIIDEFGAGQEADYRWSVDVPQTIDDVRHSLGFDDFWDSEYMKVDPEATNILAEGMEALKHTEVNKAAINRIASKIKKDIGSSIPQNKIAEDITKVFAYLQNEDYVNYADVMGILDDVARPIIESAEVKVGEEAYKNFVDKLKGYSIKLTDTQKKEVISAFGSYGRYRSYMMPLNISDKGNVTLEQAWQEIVEASGYALNFDATEGEQPLNLYDTLQSLRPTTENSYGGDIEDVSKDLAMRIVQEYLVDMGSKDARTEAERKAKEKLQALSQRMRERNAEYRKDLKADYDARLKHAREELRLNQVWRDAETNQKIAEIKAKNKQRAAEAKERSEARYNRDSIEKKANDLYNRLVNPTEKKHVPTNMTSAVLQMLSAFDFVKPAVTESDGTYSTKVYIGSYLDAEGKKHLEFKKLTGNTEEEVIQKYYDELANGNGSRAQLTWQEKMRDIQTMMIRVQSGAQLESSDTLDSLLANLDQGMADEFLDMLARNSGNVNVKDLSANDLRIVNNALSNILKAINQGTKAFAINADTAEMAQSTISEGDSVNVKQHGGIYESITKFGRIDNLTPKVFMTLLGDSGKKLYKGLRDGLNTKIRDIKKAGNFMKNTLGSLGIDSKELNSWCGDKAKIHEFNLPEGVIRLTDGQIMSLYLTSKRSGGIERMAGGILADDIKRNGKTIRQDGALHLSLADMSMIIGTMSTKQKAFADALQKYMAVECAKDGNEVSRKLYDFEKFTDPSYFPYSVDRNTVASTNANTNINQLNGIERSGFTKNLTQGAVNPLVMRDILDVFTDHVADMAAYHGYAAANKDVLRWLNYREISSADENGFRTNKTTKEAINKICKSTAGVSYINKMLMDINGSEKSQYIGNITEKLMGNYKAAAVGANLRVIVQQPTAYFRAAYLIDPKYLLSVSPTKALKNVERVNELSEIAWWKSQGYYETSIGKSLKEMVTGQQSLVESFKDKLMAPAGIADDLTWTVLYLAVEKEQKDLTRGKGLTEEEFRQLVNDRFDELVDSTQVVDSTLHRSQFMRSKDKLNVLQTAFMAEPTKSYNMLLEAALLDMKDGKPKRIGRAAGAYIVSSLATSAAAAVIDALRYGGDDDDYLEVWLEKFKENAIDNINPFNLLPVVKDAAGTIYKLLTGESMYGSSSGRFDMEGLTNLVTAVNTVQKFAKGESNKTGYGLAMAVIRPISQMTGIPLYNLSRDSVALYNALFDDIKTTVSKPSDYKGSVTNATNKDLSVEAITEEVTDAVENEVSIKDVRNAIKNEYKKEYFSIVDESELGTDDPKAKEMARIAGKGLAATLMTDDEINAEIDSWTEEKKTYGALDKAIKAGDTEAIKSEIDSLMEEKDVEKIQKHIMDNFGDTVEYEAYYGTDSTWKDSVEVALEETDATASYESVKADMEAKAAETEAKAAQTALNLESKQNIYDAIESGGDVTTMVDKAIENGMEPKTIKSALTDKYKDEYIEAVNNKDYGKSAQLQQAIARTKAYCDKQSGLNIPAKYNGDYYSYELDILNEWIN